MISFQIGYRNFRYTKMIRVMRIILLNLHSNNLINTASAFHGSKNESNKKNYLFTYGILILKPGLFIPVMMHKKIISRFYKFKY